MNFWFLGWLFPIVLLVGYLPGWMIEQDLIIRLQAAVSTKEARKAAIWGLFLIGAFVIVLPSISTVWPPASCLKKGPAGTPSSRAFLGSNRTFVMIN